MGNVIPAPSDRMNDMRKKYRLKKRELKKLYKIFMSIDKDASDSIDVAEFLSWVHQPKNGFTCGLFDLIDTDSDHKLDFAEFVQAIFTFAFFDDQDMRRFCFFLFDKDKNGTIDRDELSHLMECLHIASDGLKSAHMDQIEQIVWNLDVDRNGAIDMDEFSALCDEFPKLIYPAFQMQREIINNTWNELWWEKKCRQCQGARRRKHFEQAYKGRRHLLLARRQALRLRLTKLSAPQLLMEAVHLVLPRNPDPPIALIEGADFKAVPTRIATERMHAFCVDTTSRRKFRDEESPSGPVQVLEELNKSAGAQEPQGQGSKSMKRRKKRKKVRGKVLSQVVPTDAELRITQDPATRDEPAKADSFVLHSAAAGGRRWSQEEVAIPSSEFDAAQQQQ